MCKNPYEFTGGDCSSIKLCGIEGNTQKKEQPNNSRRYLVNKSDQTDLWTEDSTWNPNTDGICKCRDDEFYSDVNKACLPSSCGDGGEIDLNNKLSCNKCPDSYIDCQTVNVTPDAPDGKGLCAMPSCVPDPCHTLEGNNKIGTNGKCSCDNAKGFYNVPDVNSVIGYSCQKLCNPGPCESRGDCFVWKGNNVSKWEISCPDKTDMNCNNWKRVINIDQTSNYMINTTLFVSVMEGGGDAFMFEPVTPTNVFNLKDGEKYYLKDATNRYIDFKNNLKSDTKNADMIIQLKNDLLQPDANVYTIYLISQNMYVSMSDMKITLSENWKDTERCGSEDSADCNDGYNQDKNHYCNETDVGTCIGSGFLCLGDVVNNCKPGFTANPSVSGMSCACTCE